MLWPLALRELLEARSWTARLIAANALGVLGIALLLTFSRSAWLGSLAAAVILIAASHGLRTRLGVAALIAVLAAAALTVGVAGSAGFPLGQSVTARAMTLFSTGEWEPRLGIWRDTVPLIGGSPLVGYGPDTFGLVFPRFNTVYYVDPVDKAHAETLQIAATQGLVGVVAGGLILAAFLLAFRKARRLPGAVAILAGLAAYDVALQLNFTALSSALPFWIFAAAALVSWNAVHAKSYRLGHPRLVGAASAVAAAALVAMAAWGVVIPYMADASLLSAVNADVGRRVGEARAPAAQARLLTPQESVYAVEVGNIAYELGDWPAARSAYGEAIRLGTYNAVVFRNLAITDRNLGLQSEARNAALGAYYLNRFDPANRALLAQFGGP